MIRNGFQGPLYFFKDKFSDFLSWYSKLLKFYFPEFLITFKIFYSNIKVFNMKVMKKAVAI